MNVDDALRQFGDSEELPREAMAWALDNWATASPRLMARLRAFAAGHDRTETVENQAFFIAHLAGQMQEPRAYEPLCRLIADDPDLDVWLGDAVGHTLPSILAGTFDGDTEPLLAAIESPTGDDAGRGAALIALGIVTRSRGVFGDAAMRDLLRRLRREGLPREPSTFWLCWAETAAALGFADLKMEAALLSKEGLIDVADFGLAEFDRIAALARSEPDGLAGFRDIGVGPLDDAVGTLETFAFGDEDEDDGSEDDGIEGDRVRRSDDASGTAAPADPHLNPLRDVGRNDPCPCGSGKKYKKCCLSA